MFTTMIDEYAEKLKPHLTKGGDILASYGNRIISHLEEIVDAVQSDETLNVRRTFTGTLGIAGSQQIGSQIPTDQDWVLESVVIDGDAVTAFRIWASDPATATAPRFGWGTTANQKVYTIAGQGIMFAGGSELWVTNDLGNLKYYVQFRYERKKAKRNASRAGQIVRGADRMDSRTEAAETDKHAGTAQWAGNNVRGERHISEPI